MSDRFHTSNQWRLRAVGGMFGLFAVAAGAGAVALQAWPAMLSAVLLAAAAALLVWLGARLPRGGASLAERRSAFLMVAAAVVCVLLAVTVWAVAVTRADGADADAERLEVADGGTVVVDGREVSVEVDGGAVHLVVVETATGTVMSDVVLEEGDRNGGDAWGRILVVDVADDVVELAREQP